MASQLKIINASGTLYPNPRCAQEGEPALCGTVSCREAGGQQHVQYEVSAWYVHGSRTDYILQIGGSMPGVMCRWWAEDHVIPGLDMEGTAGVDHDYVVEARFVDLDKAIVSIHIYSMEIMHVTSKRERTPLFF